MSSSLVRNTSIFLSLAVLLFSANVSAQSFAPVAFGSKYYCSSMPNGTKLLFADKNSNSPLTTTRAIATVNGDIVRFQGRIQKLSKINSSLKDGKLTSSEVRNFNKIKNATNPTAKNLPSRLARRKQAIKSLIAQLKTAIQTKKREVKAISNCISGEQLTAPTNDNSISFEFKKFQGLDGLYISLMMYLPKVYNSDGKAQSSRWYCIRGPWQENEGEPRLFTTNPCDNGMPSVPGNNCSQFTPSDMYAEVYASRLYLGPGWDFDNYFVVEGEKELKEFYAGRIFSRPRTSLNDDCKNVP